MTEYIRLPKQVEGYELEHIIDKTAEIMDWTAGLAGNVKFEKGIEIIEESVFVNVVDWRPSIVVSGGLLPKMRFTFCYDSSHNLAGPVSDIRMDRYFVTDGKLRQFFEHLAEYINNHENEWSRNYSGLVRN